MTIAIPVYASMTAATIIFLQLALMMTVGFRRVKYQQGIGDGGHDDLSLLIRRHANLAENSAIFIVVLALLEMMGGEPRVAAGLGIAFVVVRVAHAIGLSSTDGANAPRFIGAMGTLLTGLGSGGYLFYIAVNSV